MHTSIAPRLERPGANFYLLISARDVPPITREGGSHLTFIGGFDDERVVENRAVGTSFLALSYPSDTEGLKAVIGTVDLPGVRPGERRQRDQVTAGSDVAVVTAEDPYAVVTREELAAFFRMARRAGLIDAGGQILRFNCVMVERWDEKTQSVDFRVVTPIMAPESAVDRGLFERTATGEVIIPRELSREWLRFVGNHPEAPAGLRTAIGTAVRAETFASATAPASTVQLVKRSERGEIVPGVAAPALRQ
jgi:hypothetical protein